MKQQSLMFFSTNTRYYGAEERNLLFLWVVPFLFNCYCALSIGDHKTTIKEEAIGRVLLHNWDNRNVGV